MVFKGKVIPETSSLSTGCATEITDNSELNSHDLPASAEPGFQGAENMECANH